VAHHLSKQRVLRLLTTVLSVVVTLAGVLFIVPSAFGLQRYVITGTSMQGTLDRGSIAFEEVVPVAELRVGDVITYTPPPASGVDHLVTHRIVSIHGRALRTQGDAVPQPDPWRFRLDAAEQSRVSFAIPYVGYPLMALAERRNRMILIGIPAGMIAVASFLQVLAALRRRPGGGTPGRPRSAVAGG
jgi:signal peptidase